MKTGQRARLITPVIEGEIKKTEYDEQQECLKHLLEYQGSDGETHSRWFLETELEGV